MNKLNVALIILIFSLPLIGGERIEAESKNNTVALNPVFAPLGTVTMEYEHACMSPKTSIGVSAWYEYKEVRARWIYAKALYYPKGVALNGLALGCTMGVLRGYREENHDDQMKNDTTPIMGLMLQYNWFLGTDTKILLGIGMGGRVAIKNLSNDSPLPKYDGDVRMVMGYCF